MQEEIKTGKTFQENEIDLGVFFNLIGKIIRKIVAAIEFVLLSLYQFLIAILLFIKRRIIWLAIGTLIGLGLGYYQYLSSGPAYYSDMVVRSNFESARLLFNRINYFNSLVKQKRFNDLSASFNITPGDAAKLISFEVAPVNDDLEAAKLYRNTFLTYKRNSDGSNDVDSQWLKTMKFEDFKRNLKSYDFPLQQVRVYSSSPDVYTKIEDGLVRSVNNNKTLQNVKESTTGMFKDEETILDRSLSGLDSLRKAYNKRITESTPSDKSEGNNVIVSNKSMQSPEIQLYDKELILKDELLNVRRRAIDQQDILQVYASFNPTGTKVPVFEQDFFTYAWWGLLIMLAILLLVEVYRYLDKVDKSKKAIL